MAYKIGIPKAMLYYDYFPLWDLFFKELGAKVIVSPDTNKEILDKGVTHCVDESCLPVKIFHGHVYYLKDKVDFLFIPKIMSVCRKDYFCPKILGLPEMIKNSFDELPEIISTTVNLYKGNNNIKKSVLEIGTKITPDLFKIRRAYNSSTKVFKEYKNLINKKIISIEGVKTQSRTLKDINSLHDKKKRTIMMVGHPYNIYDNYINMNLAYKLVKNNVKVITSETIDENKILFYSSKLPKRMFWTYGKRIIGSSFCAIEEGLCDGMIYISSFGCGMDSILVDLIERKAKEKMVPFMLITVDEQTGEAGINTRIEAFLDMMMWRDRDENNISTLG
ncbi:acyl-CoA dehydratase activase-related protein [Sporanaerobacter sp. PP17-6a]|uniref:acyl-CoA dehydratase activase-related protein n=1 Tax=Sporanaerobacter sp. PP17-6a TaxID=1891289 RepID=UPI0008A07A9B|nr:acyl-CoA dehydratase activase-related protein [Sporanaerobacter sp. PP17-6a]SCL94487.1 hypothetical protein PP176A_2677 [Sporanaerobacter sp. PP17-6a]